jgi:hypothetical protein
MGLLEHDINNLLQNVLFHKSFQLSQVKLRSIVDCEIHDANLYQKKDGWLEYVV